VRGCRDWEVTSSLTSVIEINEYSLIKNSLAKDYKVIGHHSREGGNLVFSISYGRLRQFIPHLMRARHGGFNSL
jgi:hypothetical protein